MSALRSYSQIQPRSPYLIVITDDVSDGVIMKANKPYFGIIPTATSIGVYQDYTEANPSSDIVNAEYFGLESIRGFIFKDLGRSYTLYGPREEHMYVYRECQLVRGPTVEGVPDVSPFYGGNYLIRTWAASPDEGQTNVGVCVARLG